MPKKKLGFTLLGEREVGHFGLDQTLHDVTVHPKRAYSSHTVV